MSDVESDTSDGSSEQESVHNLSDEDDDDDDDDDEVVLGDDEYTTEEDEEEIVSDNENGQGAEEDEGPDNQNIQCGNARASAEQAAYDSYRPFCCGICTSS